MTKILTTGVSGTLGSSILEVADEGSDFRMIPFSRINGDINNHNDIGKTIRKYKPDIIIHLASLTDVDYCELHPQETFQTNTIAVENIVKICAKEEIRLVYISTGAVFDGNKKEPYSENDQTNPINIYGKSKLLAEKVVASLPGHLIIRTGWLYGGNISKTNKFVEKVIIQAINNIRKIYVVNGITGSPTYSVDMARVMLILLKDNQPGLFHVVNEGIANRIEIALEVLKILGKRGANVQPVEFGYFHEKARRPVNESLQSIKLPAKYRKLLPDWKISLKAFIKSKLTI